jgi:hypothetical protein
MRTNHWGQGLEADTTLPSVDGQLAFAVDAFAARRHDLTSPVWGELQKCCPWYSGQSRAKPTREIGHQDVAGQM